jgi:hypothetical protein
MILVARTPLSDKAIDTLLSLPRPSLQTISRLRCVLHWKETEPVRILHPTFADFLTDRLRCRYDAWYINTTLHNRFVITQCLKLLDSGLRRNMCNLTLSQGPVNEALSEQLAYACKYWIDHVCSVTDDVEPLAECVALFCFTHLLHWLEGMSILKQSRSTVVLTCVLLEWVMVRNMYFYLSIMLTAKQNLVPAQQNLHELLCDASRYT